MNVTMRPDFRVLTKRCVSCKEEKETIEFSPRKRAWLGVRSVCRTCENERKRIWRNTKDNRLKQRNRQKAWHENNRERGMHAALKSKSKKRKLPFDIEVSDIAIPEYCPVLGVKLNHGVSIASNCSPSVDRIRPELGYIKGNIQVISHKANAMKQNATPAQLLKFADWIYATYAETIPDTDS